MGQAHAQSLQERGCVICVDGPQLRPTEGSACKRLSGSCGRSRGDQVEGPKRPQEDVSWGGRQSGLDAGLDAGPDTGPGERGLLFRHTPPGGAQSSTVMSQVLESQDGLKH